MPIQIKELHIKINVDEKGSNTKSGSTAIDKESIVAESVEQVMELLKTQGER